MLITVKELVKFWNIRPTGVLHVGAHLAEESKDYSSHGWGPVIWVEAQEKLANELRNSLDPAANRVFQAVIWDVDNELKRFGVASNSQSSSLLEFSTHSKSYPDIRMVEYFEVQTTRLDSLLFEMPIGNFLNLDIQGAELPAIKSLGNRINEIDYIYTEVNRKEVYSDCTKVEELDRYLKDFGFSRIATRWYLKEGWGDALYVRNSVKLKSSVLAKVFSHLSALKFLIRQLIRNSSNRFR